MEYSSSSSSPFYKLVEHIRPMHLTCLDGVCLHELGGEFVRASTPRDGMHFLLDHVATTYIEQGLLLVNNTLMGKACSLTVVLTCTYMWK